MNKNILTAAITAALISSGAANAVDVSTDGGFKITSDDGQYSAQIGGRILLDFDQTENGNTTTQQDFTDRARIYVKGDLGKDWGYKAEFNINDTLFNREEDLYIDYKGFDGLTVRIGNQKVPFGLEQMIAETDLALLERSASSKSAILTSVGVSPTFTTSNTGRNYGVTVMGGDNAFAYAASYYEANSAFSGLNASFAHSVRLTGSLGDTDSGLIHFGASHKNQERPASTLSLSDSVTGVELAYLAGAFHAQVEHFNTDALNGVTGESFYLQVGYLVNGSRSYNKGIFSGVTPQADGAWEFVLRYEDGDAVFSDIGLGLVDGEAITIGANYYANNHIRLGASFTDGEDSNSNVEGEEFRLRAQVTF